jgi:toxin ParE1/3/4
MQLSFTRLAEQDMETIANYIALDNPLRALTFVQGLRQRCEHVASNPLSHRLRPELGDNLRSFPYSSYVIFYAAAATEVTIIRILHGARDLPGRFRQSKSSAVIPLAASSFLAQGDACSWRYSVLASRPVTGAGGPGTTAKRNPKNLLR